MAWWIWIVLGLALMLAELLTPGGFYFFFFGVGAIAAALVSGLGLSSLTVQVLISLLVTAACLLVFRSKLGRNTPTESPHPELMGEVALPMTEIASEAVGPAELRGTVWSARNLSTRALQPGERCLVKQVNGLTIYLLPEK